ncbi:hypothetical protein BDZ45DRAFT_751538 [Acephala macrosclerotiorum]|nr:hypothetical protein BDZ45DRAFT_751538 [Acephala macrosclerotiorum]
MFVTAAIAAPSSPVSSERGIAARQLAWNGTGEVILCTEPNWKGECTAMTVPLAYDSCTTLDAPWAYNVSSFEPIPGVVCWVNRSNNCSDICMSPSGCNEIIEFPGYADLSTYGPWNNTIGSFTCNPSSSG